MDFCGVMMNALVRKTLVLNAQNSGSAAAILRVALHVLWRGFTGTQVLFTNIILLIAIIITDRPSKGKNGMS